MFTSPSNRFIVTWIAIPHHLTQPPSRYKKTHSAFKSFFHHLHRTEICKVTLIENHEKLFHRLSKSKLMRFHLKESQHIFVIDIQMFFNIMWHILSASRKMSNNRLERMEMNSRKICFSLNLIHFDWRHFNDEKMFWQIFKFFIPE